MRQAVMDSYETVAMAEGIGRDLPSRANSVLVEARYSLLIPGKMTYCSVVGQVQEIGPAVEQLRVGDKVIALASPEPLIALEAEDCLKLKNDDIVSETTAYWALALAIIPAIHLGQLEIGERVLVLSNDLVGQMIGDLAWLAGAMSCIVYDPNCKISEDFIPHSEPAIGPQWVNDLSVLETSSQAQSVDLLIDASGDPVQLEANLSRVRDAGRVLLVGHGFGSRFDFDLYPDLHKRSIKIVGCALPRSLKDLQQENKVSLAYLNQLMDFVRHLTQAERLNISPRSIMQLQAPDADKLSQVLREGEHSSFLIEW